MNRRRSRRNALGVTSFSLALELLLGPLKHRKYQHKDTRNDPTDTRTQDENEVPMDSTELVVWKEKYESAVTGRAASGAPRVPSTALVVAVVSSVKMPAELGTFVLLSVTAMLLREGSFAFFAPPVPCALRVFSATLGLLALCALLAEGLGQRASSSGGAATCCRVASHSQGRQV